MASPSRKPIYTIYTTSNLSGTAYCVPDMAFQNGAVVINDQDEVLLYEDVDSGRLILPRSTLQDSYESFCETPLGFLSVETGLSVERLPLLKPTRRYQNGDTEQWEDLDQELCFRDSALSTNPFSMALDIAWFENHKDSRSLDGRQAIVNWYSGIVRGCHTVGCEPEPGWRVRFLPIQKAISVIQSYDFVSENLLDLFNVLWTETKRARSTANAKQSIPSLKQSTPSGRQSTPSANLMTPTPKKATPSAKQSAPSAKQSTLSARQSTLIQTPY